MKKLNEKQTILLIMAAGILARFLYVIFMPVVEFAQYDIGSVYWEQDVLTGHLGYIMYLVKHHAIPDFDPTTVYQFNHPPVHHILGAVVVSIVKLFTDNVQTWKESVQFLTFAYSVITLWGVKKILEETEIAFNGRVLVLLLWAFQPTLIMTAGSVNNDGIGLMFQVLAVWFVLRWYKSRSYKDIFGIALTIGFGMISKLSAGLIAVPVGILFIYVFVKEWKEEKAFPAKRFLQYVAFGAVCVPIGLCWVLRCLVKFGMSPTYIAYLPDTSEQYVGMYSTMERMFIPNPLTLLSNLAHGSIGMGWNVWVQMLRTSALGECDLSMFPMWGKLLCMAMLGVNFLIMLWAIWHFLRVFLTKKYKTDIGTVILWVGCWLILMYSYLSFAYKYPHECSMNFRYVQFAMLPPMIALGTVYGSKKMTIFGKLVTAAYVCCSVLVIFTWCHVA